MELAASRPEAALSDDGELLTVRASAAMECRRKLYYVATGAEQEPEKDIGDSPLLQIGRALEGIAFRAVADLGWQTSHFENRRPHYRTRPHIVLQDGHIRITGTPDGKIKGPDDVWWSVAEVKTRNESAYKRTTSMGVVVAEPSTAAQLALYHKGLAGSRDELIGEQAPGCTILLNRNTGDVDVEAISPTQMQGIYENVMDRLSPVYEAVVNREAPPRDYDSPDYWKCKSCPFQSECWAGVARHQAIPVTPTEGEVQAAMETIAKIQPLLAEKKELETEQSQAREVVKAYLEGTETESYTASGHTAKMISSKRYNLDRKRICQYLTVEQQMETITEAVSRYVRIT